MLPMDAACVVGNGPAPNIAFSCHARPCIIPLLFIHS